MIRIKTSQELKVLADGGKILAAIMKELEKKVRPGIKTLELNELAQELILKSGGQCSFKGYEGYPSCLCASVNEEIVHAVPSERILQEGDIVSLDLGVQWQGFHTDMAVTLPVGKIKPDAKKLVEAAKKALAIGIKEVKPGNHLGRIGQAIQKYVEGQGFNVVRELCGHGIGRQLHEDPQILNYDDGQAGPELVEGMVLCLEPMVTMGDWRIKEGKDGFSYETKDGSLSAHFEHTLAVTSTGHQILTSL